MPAPPSQLFLRPTVIADERGEHDYQVIWDGIPIGRILQQPGVPFGRPNWSWGVGFPHKPQLPAHRALASDLAECQRRFKAVWAGVHAGLTEADIARARAQAEDNRKRWKS